MSARSQRGHWRLFAMGRKRNALPPHLVRRRQRLFGRHCRPAAEAGRPYLNLRPRLRQIEPLPDQSRFDSLSAANQAFVQPVQRPQIVWILASPAELSVKTEIGTIDRLG